MSWQLVASMTDGILFAEMKSNILSVFLLFIVSPQDGTHACAVDVKRNSK